MALDYNLDVSCEIWRLNCRILKEQNEVYRGIFLMDTNGSKYSFISIKSSIVTNLTYLNY